MTDVLQRISEPLPVVQSSAIAVSVEHPEFRTAQRERRYRVSRCLGFVGTGDINALYSVPEREVLITLLILVIEVQGLGKPRDAHLIHTRASGSICTRSDETPPICLIETRIESYICTEALKWLNGILRLRAVCLVSDTVKPDHVICIAFRESFKRFRADFINTAELEAPLCSG